MTPSSALYKYSGALVARATMGYGHQTMERQDAERAAGSPGVVLKIIPHVDGKPRILELVRFGYGDVVVKEAYTGPGTLDLYPHALAPLADLPVREIVSVTHTVSDVTLLGEKWCTTTWASPPADLEVASFANPQ